MYSQSVEGGLKRNVYRLALCKVAYAGGQKIAYGICDLI